MSKPFILANLTKLAASRGLVLESTYSVEAFKSELTLALSTGFTSNCNALFHSGLGYHIDIKTGYDGVRKICYELKSLSGDIFGAIEYPQKIDGDSKIFH